MYGPTRPYIRIRSFARFEHTWMYSKTHPHSPYDDERFHVPKRELRRIGYSAKFGTVRN